MRAPVYDATAQLNVTPLTPAQAPVGMPVLRELGDPVRTIETAAALLNTRAAAELSAQRLGGSYTADAVLKAITVAPLGQTNLVDVTARASTPQAAADLANAYTTATLDLRSQALSAASTAALNGAREQVTANPAGSAAAAAAQERLTLLELLRTYGDPSASESQVAVVPTSAVGLPAAVILVLAALAGLLAALAVAVLLTTRTPAVSGRAAGRGDRTDQAVAGQRRAVSVGAASQNGDADRT